MGRRKQIKYCYYVNFSCQTHQCCRYCVKFTTCKSSCKDNPLSCKFILDSEPEKPKTWEEIKREEEQLKLKEQMERIPKKRGRKPKERT